MAAGHGVDRPAARVGGETDALRLGETGAASDLDQISFACSQPICAEGRDEAGAAGVAEWRMLRDHEKFNGMLSLLFSFWGSISGLVQCVRACV